MVDDAINPPPNNAGEASVKSDFENLTRIKTQIVLLHQRIASLRQTNVSNDVEKMVELDLEIVRATDQLRLMERNYEKAVLEYLHK